MEDFLPTGRINKLQLLLFPTMGAVIGIIVTISGWSKYGKRQNHAAGFYQNSQPATFVFTEENEQKFGLTTYSYSYEQGGAERSFTSETKLDLPATGKVRIGTYPSGIAQIGATHLARDGDTLALPVDVEDSEAAVYQSMWGRSKSGALWLAVAITIGGASMVIVGFILQRVIFRSVGQAINPTGRSRRKRRR